MSLNNGMSQGEPPNDNLLDSSGKKATLPINCAYDAESTSNNIPQLTAGDTEERLTPGRKWKATALADFVSYRYQKEVEGSALYLAYLAYTEPYKGFMKEALPELKYKGESEKKNLKEHLPYIAFSDLPDLLWKRSILSASQRQSSQVTEPATSTTCVESYFVSQCKHRWLLPLTFRADEDAAYGRLTIALQRKIYEEFFKENQNVSAGQFEAWFEQLQPECKQSNGRYFFDTFWPLEAPSLKGLDFQYKGETVKWYMQGPQRHPAMTTLTFTLSMNKPVETVHRALTSELGAFVMILDMWQLYIELAPEGGFADSNVDRSATSEWMVLVLLKDSNGQVAQNPIKARQKLPVYFTIAGRSIKLKYFILPAMSLSLTALRRGVHESCEPATSQ